MTSAIEKIEEVIRLAFEARNAPTPASQRPVRGVVPVPFPDGFLTTLGGQQSPVRKYLKKQPSEMVYLVLTMMYLGRGNIRARGFKTALCDVKRRFTEPGHAINQISGNSRLGELLTKGLEKLDKARIDVDDLIDLATEDAAGTATQHEG